MKTLLLMMSATCLRHFQIRFAHIVRCLLSQTSFLHFLFIRLFLIRSICNTEVCLPPFQPIMKMKSKVMSLDLIFISSFLLIFIIRRPNQQTHNTVQNRSSEIQKMKKKNLIKNKQINIISKYRRKITNKLIKKHKFVFRLVKIQQSAKQIT